MTNHDVKVAPEVLTKINLNTTDYVGVDKGYYSDNLRNIITEKLTQTMILNKQNSKSNNDHIDWYIYKIRHLVESAFARPQHFRVATRYDKLKQHYENTIALARAYICLKL